MVSELFVSGELPVQSDGGFAPCFGCFLDGVEIPEIMGLSIHSDPSVIAFSVSVDRDAFNSSLGAFGVNLSIGSLFAASCQSQIGNPVVEGITVNVVDFLDSWINTVGHQPSDSVSQPDVSIQSDAPVDPPTGAVMAGSGFVSCMLRVPLPPTSWAVEMARWPFSPSEESGVWIISQTLADELDIGQFVASHSVLPTGAWLGALPALNSRQRPAHSTEVVLWLN